MALENKVTRNLLELKLGSIRTLKNILTVELHYVYFSQDIIRVIKSNQNWIGRTWACKRREIHMWFWWGPERRG